MAVSCDDQELNKLIESAFRAHYDDMVEVMTICAEKVARVLYQKGIVAIETMRNASEANWSKYQKSVEVVSAISVYIKARNTSSKPSELLDILGELPPVNGVVDKMRRHMQQSSPANSFEQSNSIEEEAHSNELPRTNSNGVRNMSNRSYSNDSNQMTSSMNSNDSSQMPNSVERMDSNDSNASYNSVFSSNEGAVAAGSSRPPFIARTPRQHRLSGSLSREYSGLKWDYGTLISTARRHIVNSSDDGMFSTLKDQLFYMYSDEPDTSSIIRQAVNTAELLDKVVLPRCNLVNYNLLTNLARSLKLRAVLDEIQAFSESKDNLEGNLLEGEFADMVRSEISLHRSNPGLPRTEIILKVNMKEGQATLNEFRSLVEEVFPLLYQYIDLEVVQNGSVCFVCSAPKYLEDVLIQMAKDQVEVAIRRQVVILKVGMVTIIDDDIPAIEPEYTKSEKSLEAVTQQGSEATSFLSLPPPAPAPSPPKEVLVSEPKEQVVEESSGPSLPTVTTLPQLNVVSSSVVSPVELAHDFPWERLLTWSSLSLLVLSLLAVYYAGNGEVVCNSPPHLSSSFVNRACQQSLSHWSYYPLFVFLQSIALLLPQYLWYSYSKWHVQFFFSALQRFNRHPFTAEGECELEAFKAVAKLDKQFSKSDGLVRLYVRKLILHLIVWTMCSAITLILFFGHDSQFQCPKSTFFRGEDSIKTSLFIDCFSSQPQNLVAVNFFILLISLGSIVYGFKWFFIQPVKCLKQTIEFCQNTHLSPEHFPTSGSVAHASDLDFLFQLLDHVDSGFAATVLDVHIRRHMHNQSNEQYHFFRLMNNVQISGFLRGEDGSDRVDDISTRVRHLMHGFGSDIDRDLNRVYHKMLGVEIPPLPSVHKLIYQCLHCFLRPSDKECAVEINFGTPELEYGAALGRVFFQVVSICYMSQLRGKDVTVKNTKKHLSHYRVTVPDTIFTQPCSQTNAADEVVGDLILDNVLDKDRGDPNETTVINFIIVGPIREKRNCNTANMLLDTLYHTCCYNRNCCMLTLRPVKIGSRDVDHMFQKFTPIERMFKLDDEKLQRETSEQVAIPCGLQQSDSDIGLQPEPLECVFEIKLYRFRDYGIGHQLYDPPVTEDNPPPVNDNTLMN